MKRRTRRFSAYQQTLFNKYEIDESYLQTHKQRRVCLELLEKIDKNQITDDKKMIEKIASAFQDSALYKKLASCVTIAALLVTLQSTPVMAQAAYSFQQSAAITNVLEQYKDQNIILDEDSFLNTNRAVRQQQIKTTSLHLVANKTLKNAYEPMVDNGALIDGDSNIEYYPKHEVRTLTVIDTSLEDWQIIQDAVREGEVILLDGDDNPLDTILTKLEGMKEIDCLNIISHGASGKLKFENGVIDSNALEKNKDKWERLSGYLSQDGDIQLFGCNVAEGEAGKAFIERLAELTGADVAASINPTGAEKKGGDWKLEAHVGDVAGNFTFTETAISKFLNLLLPTGTPTFGFSTSADTYTLYDKGDTLGNDYFTVSCNFEGNPRSMDIHTNSAFMNSEEQWFTIRVRADVAGLESFELEDINLSTAEYGFNLGMRGHTTDGRTIETGVEWYSGSYYSEVETYTQSHFTNWSIFNNEQLDYFEIYCDSSMFGANDLNFNSFTVSNMTPANNAPTAAEHTFITNEDNAITDGDLTAYASDNDTGDTLTYAKASDSSHGTVTVNSDGTFTYIPEANFSGTDSFTWSVSDGKASATATASININAVNDAPTAAANSFTTDEDMAVNDSLASYADDVDTGDTLTYAKAGDPTHGSVTVNPDGGFTYTPEANYNGPDSFTWSVSDGTASATATATITVNSVNDVPTVSDNTKNEMEGTTITFAASDFNVGYSDADEGAFSGIQIVILPDTAHGVLKLNGTDITAGQGIALADLGNITFVPETDFDGDTAFTWKVSDGHDYSATAAIMTLSMTGINDAPTAAGHTFTTNEDTAIVNGDLTAYASDVDTGDTLTYVKVDDPAHGTVTVNTDGSFTYTPEANFNGTDNFTWKASDEASVDSTIATATITVSAVNDAPTAAGHTFTMNEDMAVNGSLVSYAADVDTGDALTYGKVNDPAHGSVTVNPDGSFTYTPEANYNGPDSFTWSASDGTSDSNVAAVTITVSAVNDAPTAAGHTFTANEDIVLNRDLTAYAADVDTGDALTYAKVSDPAHGSVTVNPNGSFTYTPEANYNGPDSFTWSVSDGTADSNVVTATITVNAVNDAPTVSNNTKNETEGTTITFAASDFNVEYSDVENDTLSGIRILTLPDPAHGALKLNGVDITAGQEIALAELGNVTFLPAADFDGDATFTWKVSDGHDYSATAAIMTLSMTGINDAPTAAGHTFTTNEDTAIVNGDLTAYASDVDTGDTLTYVKVDDPAHGSVTVNTDGSFTYTPEANFNGTDSFTWKASDEASVDSTIATATITVSAVNDAPTAASHTFTTNEDTAIVNGDLTAYASDVDTGDTLTYVKVDDPAHGTVTVNTDGSFTYTPEANYNGPDSFTWSASDGTADSTIATATITVSAVNDAPTSVGHTFTANEDIVLNGDLTAYVSDVDTGDSLTYTLVSDVNHGTLNLATDGNFTYTPAANFNGTDDFTWSVWDGKASATAIATITVSAVNDAPTISNSTKNGAEDTPMTFEATDFSGVYSDVENGVFSGIQIATLPDAAHGVLKLSGVAITEGQEIPAGSLGSITFVPVANFNGNTSFTWKASDGIDYSISAAIMTLAIANTNDVPAATDHAFTTNEDTDITNGDLTAYATDIDTGVSLTYSLVSGVSHGNLTLNADGTFTYTPGADFNGTDSFTWKVSDGTADSNTATATITINAINDAPTTTGHTFTTNEDIAIINGDLTTYAADVDTGVSLMYELVTDVLHGSLTLNADGTFIYIPEANFNGTDSFTWKVSDGIADSNAATATITVNAVNDVPTATDHDLITNEDTPIVNGDLTAYTADVDMGYALIYTKVGNPTHGSVTVNPEGSFTYTPEANFSGTDSFTWKVNDGTADSNAATATITVDAINDAPTAASNTKNGTEDTTLTFTAADFSGGYSDTESNALSKVHIVSLPDAAHGVLKLNSEDITAGQEISAVSLGSITFVPAANFNGSTSFSWKASDGTDYSASAATMTLAIASVNDAPTAPTNVMAAVGDGRVTVTFTPPPDDGGSIITKYIVTSYPGGVTAEGTTSPITVTGLTNGTVYTFKIKAVNAVGEGLESTASNVVTPQKETNEDRESHSESNSASETGIDILINGNAETAATITTTWDGDQIITTVIVNGSKMEEKLKSEGSNAVVTISAQNNPDVVVGLLNGQTVKNMEVKEAVLEIKTENVTYTLPASQINIDNVSSQIGRQVELKDITISVTVSEPPEDTVKVIEDTADKNNYQIVVQPVQFEINCTSAGKTVEVSKFNAYVERTVAVPEGIDPSKITTGVILNPDGTFSHVPTRIIIVDGKYYAKINSLTNSTYSVIWSPKTFKDVETHWAKDAVNDMGSRLVINGISDGNFAPEQDITRAEFVSILVKGLGLMRPGTGKDIFNDVPENSWYYDAVSIAYENELTLGTSKDMFKPMEKITREQAMAMVERAMDITGLKAELMDDEENNILSAFKDLGESSEWVRESAAACIKAGVIEGKDNQTLAPKDYITRAEVAVIIERLLQKSNLI